MFFTQLICENSHNYTTNGESSVQCKWTSQLHVSKTYHKLYQIPLFFTTLLTIVTKCSEENRWSACRQHAKEERRDGAISAKEETVRDLLVPMPSQNNKVYPRIWQSDDLRRVKTASRVVTKEEKQLQIERMEAEKQRLEWECERRKKLFRNIDLEREKTKKKITHSDDDECSPVKVLDRALLAKQEQVCKRNYSFYLNKICLAIKIFNLSVRFISRQSKSRKSID